MPTLSDSEFAQRAVDLEWVLCDADGVLTDGGLYYDRQGHNQLRFDARDGFGLKVAQLGGLKVGILSGRRSSALERRATELGLESLDMGVDDKGAGLETFLERHSTVARRIAFIGDDLPDLVVLERCGLSFAPADGAQEVKDAVHRVLDNSGGHGAVREMVEILLRARGDWERLVARFTREG
jgi:3-deoxy-D-manno-octulosonate 8-phosphate phosphatase (KDO 8-P phosphatase)